MSEKTSETPIPTKSLAVAPFNVVKDFVESKETPKPDYILAAGEKITAEYTICEQFSTGYEAYVYLRDVCKMKGKVLNEKGEDVTSEVVPSNRIDTAKAPQEPAGGEKKEG